PSDLTCPPFYLFPPEALALVPAYLAAGESPDAPGSFIAWLHRRLAVYGHVFRAPRYDVGTPEAYAAACRLFEARARPPRPASPPTPALVSRVRAGPRPRARRAPQPRPAALTGGRGGGVLSRSRGGPSPLPFRSCPSGPRWAQSEDFLVPPPPPDPPPPALY